MIARHLMTRKAHHSIVLLYSFIFIRWKLKRLNGAKVLFLVIEYLVTCASKG